MDRVSEFVNVNVLKAVQCVCACVCACVCVCVCVFCVFTFVDDEL